MNDTVARVTISGPGGSGKSSVIKDLSERFGFKTADIGRLFRERAEALGISIREYDKYVEKHPEEDLFLDEELRKLVLSAKHNIVVSWRMGFHFAPEALSIWLDVSPDEGARRILGDSERHAETKASDVNERIQADLERMDALRERLLNLHRVDFTERKHYAVVIDTTGLSPEEVLKKVVEAIAAAYPKALDEQASAPRRAKGNDYREK